MSKDSAFSYPQFFIHIHWKVSFVPWVTGSTFDFHFRVWNMEKIYVWAAPVPPGLRWFSWCSHLIFFFFACLSPSPFSGRWITPWLLRALKTELPLKSRQRWQQRDMRGEYSRRRDPQATQIWFPLVLASKNKGIPEKIRAGPHPKPPLLLLLLLLPLPPFPSQTHSTAKVISCTHQWDIPSLLLHIYADLISRETWQVKEDGSVCVCVKFGLVHLQLSFTVTNQHDLDIISGPEHNTVQPPQDIAGEAMIWQTAPPPHLFQHAPCLTQTWNVWGPHVCL